MNIYFSYFYEIPIFYYIEKQKLITRLNYFTDLRNFVKKLDLFCKTKRIFDSGFGVFNML